MLDRNEYGKIYDLSLGESLVSEVLTEVCSSDVIPGGKVSVKPLGSSMRESLG